jgi:hypothetical protein
MIRGQNRYEDLVNWNILLNGIFRDQQNVEIFAHGYSRVVLFRKVEDVSSWTQLRPISIIPAWLITLEKIVKPIVENSIQPRLSRYQHGFKRDSSIYVAKAIALLNMKMEKKHAVLVDIKKAYDSVDLQRLDQMLQENLGDEAKIIRAFIKL